VGSPSFDLEQDSKLKRAGLDYWDDVDLTHSPDWETYKNHTEPEYFLATKFADRPYDTVNYSPGDSLIFGGESRGIPKKITQDPSTTAICLPMTDDVRSFNVCNVTAVVLFEALRQNRNAFSDTPYSQLDETCTQDFQT